MNNYGLMLQTGRGTANDPEEGFKWILAAAEAGDSDAMANAGEAYAEGPWRRHRPGRGAAMDGSGRPRPATPSPPTGSSSIPAEGRRAASPA